MSNKLHNAFSSAIKKLRLQHKLSQEDLASIAEIDRTYISGIERGVRNPTIKSIQKIIDSLDEDEIAFLELVKQNLAEN